MFHLHIHSIFGANQFSMRSLLFSMAILTSFLTTISWTSQLMAHGAHIAKVAKKIEDLKKDKMSLKEFAAEYQQTPALKSEIDFKEGELKNGLKYILVRVPSAKGLMGHAVGYNVGSADEESNEHGLAHFFEHMQFKGTNRYPNFHKEIAKRGLLNNAYTFIDYTVYYESGLKEHLEASMKLEADRMISTDFNEKYVGEFYKERNVVLQERKMRFDESPARLLEDLMYQNLFSGHGYSHSVIGLDKDICHLDLETAKNFKKKWYAPNVATVVVTGDIDFEKTEHLINEIYGPLKRSDEVVSERQRQAAGPVKKQLITLHHQKASSPQFLKAYRIPMTSLNSPKKRALLTTFNALLNMGEKSLLKQKLLKEKKVAIAASSSLSMFRDYALFELMAIPAKGISLEELQKELSATFEEFKTGELSDQRVQKMANAFAKSSSFSANDSTYWLNAAARAHATGKNFEDIVNFSDSFQDLTAEEVLAIGSELIREEEAVTGHLFPSKNPVQETRFGKTYKNCEIPENLTETNQRDRKPLQRQASGGTKGGGRSKSPSSKAGGSNAKK